MAHADVQTRLRDVRGDWVRLRTLIVLRWMAIGGQVAALLAAPLFQLHLPMGLCALAVGASVAANLAFMLVYPVNKRLTETEAMLMLLFDLGQLIVLLSVTGGTTNPFALLILAPVTIAASALELRAALIVAGSAVLLVTVIAFVNLPLMRVDGGAFQMPMLFRFGFWLSLVIGIVFMGVYSRRVATEIGAMSNALFATQLALSREQKLTDLGGVVAAAAHELGTPLATIKLVSAEMIDELAGLTDLQDDARLIYGQADRCRDILRAMGPTGKDDLQVKQAPLAAVVQEAAEPHLHRGKLVVFTVPEGSQPMILRRPEVIHGLRNLVQNAVDFARSRVWIDVEWGVKSITLRIVDDGGGFPAPLIGRIGDPFVRRRKSPRDASQRPEYEGMGLGLFIAKTLLERTGAVLTFANAADPFLSPDERPERCGAVVEVTWPLGALLAPPDMVQGENLPNRD